MEEYGNGSTRQLKKEMMKYAPIQPAVSSHALSLLPGTVMQPEALSKEEV
jgi:hypothetical protein